MKRTDSKIVVLLFILLTVLSCGKFEEGPKISFRSVGKRLHSTIWKIQTATKNDVDISADVFSHFNRISFSGNDDEYSIIVGLGLYDGLNFVGTGSWYYYTDDVYSNNYDETKMYMRLIYFPGDTAPCYPFPKNKHLIFSIQRLTMKELWLQHTDSIGN